MTTNRPPLPQAPAGAIARALAPFLTAERVKRMRDVLDCRTARIVPVLDRVHDPHNLAAVLRSAEALGYQRVAVCESPSGYEPSPGVSLGAERWLTVERHQDPAACLASLRAGGFRIAVTHLSSDAVAPSDLPLDRPLAVVLGNEKDGVGEPFLSAAELNVVLPMVGFTRSFNVSVASALFLGMLHEARVRAWGRPGDLTEEEQLRLLDSWMYADVAEAPRILERLGTC